MPSLLTSVTVLTLVVLPLVAQSQSGAEKAKPATPMARNLNSAIGKSSDGHPDISGVWSFRTLTPLERPAEFAGKTTLTQKEAEEYAKRTVDRTNKDDRSDRDTEGDVAKAYNDAWWDRGTKASRQTSLVIDPPDGKLPQLTAEGERRAAANRAHLNRIPEGPEDRSLGERCIMGFNAGPPMLPSAYNNNMEIVQTPDTIALMTEMVHNTRIIPLDGRPHSTIRQWVGDSRGHWEGNTLVVDTINFTNDGVTGLRAPTDEHYHLIERFTRKDADTLLYEFTVDDPTVWTKPWTASVPMTKGEGAIYEYACHEGNYGMEGMLRGARADEAAGKTNPAK